MEAWEYNLASEFTSRNNPTAARLGACIGKVESLKPVIISIQSGKFMLHETQIYICNQLLERESTYDKHEQNGTIDVGKCTQGYQHNGSNFSAKSTGKIHLNEVWKVGDYVMVVPDESEQHFFIVDILRGVS